MSGRVAPSRAVIFDLDGTLVDSAPDIAAALNAALAEWQLAPLPLETIKTMVGGGARRLVERALANHGGTAAVPPIDDVLSAFLVAYRAEPAVRTVLYPEARETLRALASAGVPLGIATNKPQDLTLAILDAVSIRGHFGAVVGSTDGMALKPAPDMLLAVLAELEAEPAASIMVGDSAADVGAAGAAGMRILLLNHGYNQEPLESLGADGVFAGFGALLPALIRELAAD